MKMRLFAQYDDAIQQNSTAIIVSMAYFRVLPGGNAIPLVEK